MKESAMRMLLCAVVGSVVVAGGTHAQSLYEPEASSQAQGEVGTNAPVVLDPVESAPPPTLEEVSLYIVEAPPPRVFEEQDLVTIIVSERSKFEREQTLETDKEYKLDAAIQKFIDLHKLLETRIEQGPRDNLLEVALESGHEFKGEGTYERDDKLTGRITARVIEVKPNGTLLLEARSTLATDEETQTILLSGICRPDDITDQNTVQSNQLFDLVLDVQHTGNVEKTTRKGLIPQVLETLFNF